MNDIRFDVLFHGLLQHTDHWLQERFIENINTVTKVTAFVNHLLDYFYVEVNRVVHVVGQLVVLYTGLQTWHLTNSKYTETVSDTLALFYSFYVLVGTMTAV